MRARVIRAPRAEGERWSAPALQSGAAPARDRHEFAPSASSGNADVSEYKHGREEGFASGYEDGLEAARAELSASLATLAALTAGVREPMAKLDEQVDQELARLAMAIARQVVRRELSSDPQQIVAVVREARAALSDVRGRLRIALHPDEAPVVRGMFSEDESLSGIEVAEDPAIARGGCTLTTDVSFVDAQVETRLARLAVQLLGDERADADGEARP